jgi:hypothetical protein
LKKEKITKNDTVTVSIDVINTRNRLGKEFIQLYISDIDSSLDGLPKEL